MNIIDYVLILIIAVCVYFAVRKMFRRSKNGGCGCGCSKCGGCSYKSKDK